ncbi:MAG: hypothetical protein Q9181_001271 [Wetmoreana brouardii]
MPAKARPKSMLSFTHRKSSSSSQVKVDNLTETTEEKASHRVTSKADPTKAINEAQPRQRPQHRHVVEAPGGYYSNRMSMGRPDSTFDNYGANYNQPGYSRRAGQRVNSDPALYGTNSQGLYPAHVYHQSYDTVASASGNESHNTDPWGNSTDPSSENSSIDRVPQAPKPDSAETYGFNGFGGAPQFQGPILEDRAMSSSDYGQMSGYGQPQKLNNGPADHNRNAVPPTPPPHALPKQNPPRVPIKLGSSPDKPKPSSNGNAEKRKSWLKRRFSRS